MAGLVNLDLGSIVKEVASVADDLFTSDEERMQMSLQEKQIDNSVQMKQMDVNIAEANHKDLFVAGWRPFIGWVCGLGFIWQFVIYPIFVWGFSMLQAFDVIPYVKVVVIDGISTTMKILPPEPLDVSTLLSLAAGMLGLGGMRMVEGLKGVKSDSIKQAVQVVQEKKKKKWFWQK